MHHQHLPRGISISQSEIWVSLVNRFVPSQFVLVDQFREEQCRHRLGVGSGQEERVGVDRVRLAERLHAETFLKYNLAAVD